MKMTVNAADILKFVHEQGEPSVLATVIAVEGHAYRKEGAAMVLRPSGDRAGMISPGCLEDDLSARVPGVLASGLPELVHYDMRPEEDPVWGDAIGCGGRIAVLLEPLSGELLQLLMEAKRQIGAGKGVVLERRRDGARIAYRLRSADAPMQGGGLGRGTDDSLQSARGAGGFPGDELLYVSEFRPRPRLILFGAGRDAPLICAAAARIGFRVVVTDWRAGLLSPERFPEAAERVAGTPAELAEKLAIGPADYVVVCSHQLRHDRDMLARLLPARPAYIGVMGSQKRIDLLFEGLEWTPNVHAPVGLDIGAEGPEEIAVSIAAELISVRAAMAARSPAGNGSAEFGAAGKGALPHADRGIVFGCRTGQPHGRAQAVR